MAAADTSKRPADDRIPAAVRAVFETNRMKTAWSMASSATSDSRLAAIEGVCRILAKEGLTLEDVMTAVLALKPAAPAAPSMADAFGGFGDIFGAMNARRQAEAAPAAAPRNRAAERIRREGSEIPATIHGTIRILDEREISRGRMLVFEVTDSNYRYGPIVCFANTGIERLKAGVEEDAFMAMSVRQANGEGLNPTATNIRRC